MNIRFCLSLGECHRITRSTNVACVQSLVCVTIAFVHSVVSDRHRTILSQAYFYIPRLYLYDYHFHLSHSRFQRNCLSDAPIAAEQFLSTDSLVYVTDTKVLFPLLSVDHIGTSFTNKKKHGF